ncbi:hypothetical protein ETAA8_52270 [Anatilimnocola aggregata]|uniref:Uncharacterized protein n=1 Tax=Anatilimnocola aggregata TaxID=2528021 RepID=A0A517YIQ8_9BACT|nr:hypothetical protein [Anatilimnocola aggregata]QDU30108.1 hypothetical protein ETAA8_52270 [Anatilimnocola aggregata]
MTSPKFRMALSIVLALGAAIFSSASSRAEDTAEKPLSALIVYDHDGKTTAIRVEGTRQLAILESYFPSYRTRPESDEAGAWEAKYEVFFNMKHGQSYRVLVAPNSRFWSMGRGDFEIRGYFSDFVAALLNMPKSRGATTPPAKE